MKIDVTNFVYWAVKALASEERRAAATVFGELIEEALRARALNGGPPALPPEIPEDEILLAAGAEGMALEDFREHLRTLGWRSWVDERMELAEKAE